MSPVPPLSTLATRDPTVTTALSVIAWALTQILPELEYEILGQCSSHSRPIIVSTSN